MLNDQSYIKMVKSVGSFTQPETWSLNFVSRQTNISLFSSLAQQSPLGVFLATPGDPKKKLRAYRGLSLEMQWIRFSVLAASPLQKKYIAEGMSATRISDERAKQALV